MIEHKSIALVDLSYHFKKNYHTVGNETPFAAAKATLADLQKLREGVGHVILCKDSPPYKRSEIHPEYKANRPKPETEELAQRRWLAEEIKRAGFSIAACEGYEADDIIATLAKNYGEWCSDVRIVCPDKDAAQCVRGNVRQFIPPTAGRDWVIRDRAGVVEKFGVEPELMPMFQALQGDKGDNVPGVTGIGAVKAKALVNQYPSVIALGAAVVEKAGTSTGWATLSKEWETGFIFSLALVTLATNVPLDFDALLVPLKPAEPKPPIDDMTEATYDDAEPANEVAPEPPSPEPVALAVAPPSPAPVTRYGLCDEKLQPTDLEGAITVSKWICSSQLYTRKFNTPAQVFVAIAHGKELGIGMIASLDNTHMIDGKPVKSADFIRALAERDPSFEYLYPKLLSAERVVWVGKRKGYPEPVEYAYSIEDAKQAGLISSGSYGKKSNWLTRPQDMLSKTAGSKLARILWPAATLGLYCPEELGHAEEESYMREAA